MMGQREEAKKKIILVRESQSVLGPDGGFGILHLIVRVLFLLKKKKRARF